MSALPKPEENRHWSRRRCDAHYRAITDLARELLLYSDAHPLHRFSSGTQKFLVHTRPVMEQLDALDCERPAK